MEPINNLLLTQYFSTRKQDQVVLNFFWVGFGLHALFFALSFGGGANYVISQLFQLIGLALLFPSMFYLIQIRFESNYLRVIFGCYAFWLLTVMIRGFVFDYTLIKALLFNSWTGILLYFTPLLVLFPRKPYCYRTLFDVIAVFGLVYLGLTMLNLPEILTSRLSSVEEPGTAKRMVEVFSKTLGIPAAFILLTYSYHSLKRRLLALAVMGAIIIVAVIQARRGLIFMAVLPLMIAYFVYLKRSRAKSILVIISVIGALALNIYALDLFMRSELFTNVRSRGLEDTRTKVHNRFFMDMKATDWLIGRGVNGTYFCPEVSESPKGERRVIETDYLQVVLKGGLVSLVLLLLILVPAAFKGLFRSRNLLAQAAGFWIVLALINMGPSTINTFTLNYVLVWICVGICFSPTLRNMPDEVLKQYFLAR